MPNEDLIIIDFLHALAAVKQRFRDAHIFVEKLPFIDDVSTTMSCDKGEFNEALIRGQPTSDLTTVIGIEISYSVDAELVEIVEDEKYSLGASLAIRFLGDHWLLQGEVGWPCVVAGWEDWREFELLLATARNVIAELDAFCATVLDAYRDFASSRGLSDSD